MNYKLSKSDWEKIGLKAGWLKKARFDTIVAYTWDADVHSPKETKRALKTGLLKATNPDARLDEHGIPEVGVEDSEGNEISPVFEGSEDAAHFFGDSEYPFDDEDSGLEDGTGLNDDGDTDTHRF